MDRTVHAELDDLSKIVRYDRAGKWWIERVSPPYRRRLSVTEAVQFVERFDQARLGRPGGSTFDRMVRAKFQVVDGNE